jgi:hypothetical protein
VESKPRTAVAREEPAATLVIPSSPPAFNRLVPEPPLNRLAPGLYPLLERSRGRGGGVVSPFRLPDRVEAGLWEPRRYPPVLPGTASGGGSSLD